MFSASKYLAVLTVATVLASAETSCRIQQCHARVSDMAVQSLSCARIALTSRLLCRTATDFSLASGGGVTASGPHTAQWGPCAERTASHKKPTC